jgi:hypothetical protein
MPGTAATLDLDGENGDENRAQRDGDDCENGIAAHASSTVKATAGVRPLANRKIFSRSTTQLASK